MENKTEEKKRILEIVKSIQLTETFFIFNYVNETEKLKIELNFLQFDEGSGKIFFEINKNRLEELKKVMAFSKKLTLFFPRRSLSIIAEKPVLDQKNQNILFFDIPDIMYYYERRKNPRVKLVKPLQVNFPENLRVFKANCYDVGIDGFSVFFTSSIKPNYGLFKKEMVINGIGMPQFGEGFLIGAKVVNVLLTKPFELEEHPYEGLRVSFQILDFDESIKPVLQSYMHENSLFEHNFLQE